MSNITPSVREAIDPDIDALIAVASRAARRHGISVRAVLSTAVASVTNARAGAVKLDFIPIGET